MDIKIQENFLKVVILEVRREYFGPNEAEYPFQSRVELIQQIKRLHRFEILSYNNYSIIPPTHNC